MAIEINDEMRELIDSAHAEKRPMNLGISDPDGQPHINLRGSIHVHAADELAFWARHAEGDSLKSIAANPKVVVAYFNPEKGKIWTFYGRARIVESQADKDTIYEGSSKAEQERDPDRLGTGVVIALDRVIERGQVIMER